LREGEKEDQGRRPWAIYSRSWCGRGARVGEIGWWGRMPCWSWAPGQRSGMTHGPGRSEGEGVLACGPSASAREELGRRTVSERRPAGSWAGSRDGLKWFPSAFSDFFISFPFFFFLFSDLFHILCNIASNPFKSTSKIF
jgi:hypothetical protein